MRHWLHYLGHVIFYTIYIISSLILLGSIINRVGIYLQLYTPHPKTRGGEPAAKEKNKDVGFFLYSSIIDKKNPKAAARSRDEREKKTNENI